MSVTNSTSPHSLLLQPIQVNEGLLTHPCMMCVITLKGVTNISCVSIVTASCTSTGDRGICVAVFHCMVTMLLLLLVLLTGVVTFSYINNLDLKQMDGKFNPQQIQQDKTLFTRFAYVYL